MPTEIFLTAPKNQDRNQSLNENLKPGTAAARVGFRCGRAPLRRIAPGSGRALEVLGHAIEYLADEYALTAIRLGELDSADPRVEAVQVLMALNREVYYACPEIEPVWQRITRAASSLLLICRLKHRASR